MTASAVRPFPFASEFHDEEFAAHSLLALEREVAALRQQLSVAREEGREAGLAEALATLRAERETALLAATEALATGLSELALNFDRTEEAVARLGADLALDFADQLAARALERDPSTAIDQALGRVLKQVRRGQPIRLLVAPDLVAVVEEMVEARQAADRRRLFVTILGDPALATGDARLEWDDGSLVLDRAARRAAMDAEIADLLAA